MDHLDLAGVIASTPVNWNLPLFDQQDAIYLSSSRQMLEPILEETSEDEEHSQNSWSPYEQTATTSFWSGSASESETGSVIRIEINKDADSISERDFACPAKRARRSDEFLQQSSSQQIGGTLDDTVILRRPHVLRPDYVAESSMSSLERFLAFEAAARDSLGGGANSLQRSSTGSARRFDDFCLDPDSVSYQSLSRSSSLIQFESLERQLTLQEQHASMSSLGNSSPSVLSFEGGVNAGSNSGSNSGNNSRRGSQSSLLKQRFESSEGRLHQTYYDLNKLNFDDDESTKAPVHKQCLMLFGGNMKSMDSGNQSTTFRSGSDSESSTTSSGSGNSVLTSTKPSAEDLSDATSCGKSMRTTAFQRGGKNSAENLSEDSGYCEPSNLRRSKSKSIPKNFEKFCEEEEDYGQTSYEHEFAPTTALQHSKTNRERHDENVDNHHHDDNEDAEDAEDYEEDDDNVSGDVCQPKINDVTFIVMESASQANATDRSATVIPPPPSYPPPSPPPVLLETNFDALMYTTTATATATATPSAAPSFACVKNSPKRDIAATSPAATAAAPSIECGAHRSTAHSPSPVASDISARSSTSTTPSTCASAASFTWYAPTQMQRNESSADEDEEEEEEEAAPLDDELGGTASGREFSTLSFSLRNSLPDLREAYGSVSENPFFFSNPQRPTNGDVLEEHSGERSSEEIGGAFLEEDGDEEEPSRVGDRSENRFEIARKSGSTSSHSTTPEKGDVTTDFASVRNRGEESKSRRHSAGVEVGSRDFDSDYPYIKRVSSVPSELNKVGRKKRKNPRHTRYNRDERSSSTSSSSSSSSSSTTSSESEDRFSVEFKALGRCCSWTERRQKFQETAKRRPRSLFGYINASYQDLTQLDYMAEGGKNQCLLKRAGNSEAAMSEKRRSAALPDYEHIICKGNFLLDELSEIYDRNVSILNDKPADSVDVFDEDIEETMLLASSAMRPKSTPSLQRPAPPQRHRKHSHSSAESLGDRDVAQHVQLMIRKPPARRKNKSNTSSLTSEIMESLSPIRTFDQDPTNLRTSYAQSLEKCNFDPKELSNTDLSSQQKEQKTRSISKRRFHSQANNTKKKNLVSSTPNLNAYDHGAEAEDELEDEIFVSSAHTSMHQLPQGGSGGGGVGARAQKPLGILLPAGSRTSFGKEVSFCPIVSKYSWQEQSSEEMNEQTKNHNEVKRNHEEGDQMFLVNHKENTERKSDDDDDDDDDLLCNDIDATLAYNTKENELIAVKEEEKPPFSEQLRELNTDDWDFDEEHEKRVCENFIEELRANELIDGQRREKERKLSSEEEQQAIIQATTPPNIVTSTKLVTTTGLEKTTTIMTRRLMPNASNEALASVDSTAALDEAVEVSHKTTLVSATTATPEVQTNEPTNKSDVSVGNKCKSITGQAAPRPLSIQLPILSEPPINRAHHILYASQQLLDNYEKHEAEFQEQSQQKQQPQQQQQQKQRLKAASANNLSGISGSGTMSKQQTVSLESQHSTNNNNDLSKMKSKFKADEKHPNSKGFLSRFAHGLRFSLRRNKKKQLQKDQQQQQQQQQQEQQTKPEFVPELQFNVVKDNSKKEKESKAKNKPSKSNNTSSGKRGKSPDFVHIPLKGPLPAGSRTTAANASCELSVADNNSLLLNSSDVSNASTVNVEQSLQNGATVQAPPPPTVDTKAAITITPTTKLVTGKPPLPKQPPPPRTSSLPQNAAHAHHHQQQKQKQYAPAVAVATSFVSKHQPQQWNNDVGLPGQTLSDSCEDFLASERSYYDDFKNQLNSGMQANGGCTLATAADTSVGGIVFSSPSRGSVSQKTQMFNNMQRGSVGTAPVPASASVSVTVAHHNQTRNQNQNQNQNSGKIGLIETNLDTHETIITGKTRSMVDIGPSQLKFVNASGKRLNLTGIGANNVLIYNDDDDDDEDGNNSGDVVDVKTTTAAGQIASVRRPHKSMEFLLDKENQKNVMPPENELQKSHEHNPAALSEHQLRIQASLQRLNIPDWFRQYNQTQTPETGTTGGSTYKPGNFTRKRTQESGRWAGLNSKTTSLSSLGSHRSDRSPLLLSPSAHSHHGGQTTNAPHQPGHVTSVYSTAAAGTGQGSSGGAFSRWSTSQLNSSQTSPSVSQRCSFSRGGPINSSFMSVASSGTNNSVIRNSFRQPYLGWRSTEKLSQRTAHERLASSMLAQQQRISSTQRPANGNINLQQQQHPQQQPVTPEIQSSIKEVTSAIVHYVNDQTNEQRSRSTSPNSRKCWLESSFVGIRPLDSPQTPVIETAGSAFNVAGAHNLANSSNNFSYNNPTTAASTHPHSSVGQGTAGTTTSSSPSIGLTTSAANVLRMNGLSLSGGAPDRSLSSASLEDVLASLLGLPTNSSAVLPRSDPYDRSTTGGTVSDNPMVHSRHLQQQQQQQQQLKINQIDPRFRRRSEGDAPNSQKQQQRQQQQLQQDQQQQQQQQQEQEKLQQRQNVNKSNEGNGAATIIDSAAGENPNLLQQQQLQQRRVSLGDSSESCNNQTNTSNFQVRCRNTKCEHSATPSDAKKYYKSCHNCTYLYCSRECRRAHWEKHRKACLHSRASNLCRQVLATCKDDLDSQRHLSLLARRGFLSQGRGVVRVLFRSAEAAEGFIKHGFQCMGEASYVRWPDLMPAEMGLELYAELLKLSTEYKPDSKMLIYVAICVVSEAPGMGQAPVRWERQLVSRCAKLKLCKSVLAELEQQQLAMQQQHIAAVVAVPEPSTEILILTFNPNLRTSMTHRELILSNILDILSRRGVLLRKHYPEIFQRLQSFTECQTDKFNPVTLHPRDSQTGQSFVCIIMPVHSDSEIIKLPSAADGGNRVTTVDVGSPAALAQLDDDELLTRSTS